MEMIALTGKMQHLRSLEIMAYPRVADKIQFPADLAKDDAKKYIETWLLRVKRRRNRHTQPRKYENKTNHSIGWDSKKLSAISTDSQSMH